MFLNKGEYDVPVLFNNNDASLALFKSNLVAKMFLKNLIMSTQIRPLTSFSIINMRLHYIPIPSKIITKITIALDYFTKSSPDKNSFVVLKKHKPPPFLHIFTLVIFFTYFYIAYLFIKSLKGYYIPDFRKVSFVVPVFKNVG